MTHDCIPRYAIEKFADDTTVVGLIRINDDLTYREEVEHLVVWCRNNNLILNVDKAKEITVDFRKNQPSHTPLLINNVTLEVVRSTKFLRIHITDDLTWSVNIASLVKKSQQCLHLLSRKRRAHLPLLVLSAFYRNTIESGVVVAMSLTVKIVERTAKKPSRSSLPSIHDIPLKHDIALNVSG